MNSAFLRGYQCPPDVFAELCVSLLQSGKSIRVFARGDSMLPNLRGGDRLLCSPLDGRSVRVGDIVLYGKYAGQELSYEGHDYLIMREDDILVVL